DQFPTEEEQERERLRLFGIIEKMVKWENTTNENVLNEAREEILKSTGGNPPPVLDPFCGGGSIPLEAQRLGLEAHASDLNPVAVLITKALIEIPPRFAGRPPINPDSRRGLTQAKVWKGAAGLAEDVRYYGKWMRDEAERRIGHLYPKVKLTKEQGGKEATVIAWLWARTVKCPNPACSAMMPLVRSFALSTKKGKEAWVEPVVNQQEKTVRFEVKTGKGKPPEGTVSRKGARCVVCGQAVPFEHIRSEGRAGRMSAQLMAIVAEGERSRVYVSPNEEHVEIASKARPWWKPDTDLPEQALGFRVQLYGMTKHADLFTPRQLVALTTFSDLVGEARERVLQDAIDAGVLDDEVPLNEGGNGATAYADAVATYLGLGISKLTDYNCVIVTWSQSRDQAGHAFTKQALPMVWDFTEVNPFAEAAGDLSVSLNGITEAMMKGLPVTSTGNARQLDSSATIKNVSRAMISTDPPYFDNIGYGDLSDFFYVWLRRSLNEIYPDLFSTLLVPKAQELIATPYRFGGDSSKAEEHFLTGLHKAFLLIRTNAHPDYPVTVYYAFKQSEEDDDEDSGSSAVASTGWETMLEGLIQSGFCITGTWPMRTERGARSVSIGTNALASSIVLVCRPRPESAPLATRREFLNALKRELPDALRKLQHGNIAPVDLAQAAIGPGMAVFSRYAKVIESDGSPMRVRTALQLINQMLDEVLAEQESEYDADTRWALAWFEQFGMNEGAFGTAETLSKAKNTAVSGMVEAGIVTSRGGKVRLLRRDELMEDWDPARDGRLTVWEVTQHLIRALETGGEQAAAQLLAKVGSAGEVARDLAYRLYTTCERKNWSQEALAYNSLVVAWPEVQRLSAAPVAQQTGTLFE
ncbi:MAG: hypothetical protein AB1631_33955, partial [Acidobacteriota bacterium]